MLYEPHHLKAWSGWILFFGMGSAIGLTVAFRMLERGDSTAMAVTFGSCAGVYGAWFLFYVVLHALAWIKSSRDSAGRDQPLH